ncbi:oxidoreductase [Angomonas deanei]|nr:oxidoreductase [Angomonas deanei]|eukprot:EPY35219.1 oxidoreductase [Angomonas deanei]
MGNSQSADEARSIILSGDAPKLLPTSSVGESTGKPITCSGWICEGGRTPSAICNTSLSQITVLTPGPTQIRVKIYAAGVNNADVNHLKSDLEERKLRRLSATSACGADGAGVIESIGWSDPGECDLKVGDRVLFLADFFSAEGGTFCQYAVVDRDIVSKIPPQAESTLSFPEAGALPTAGGTAFVALFDKLRIQSGQSIFISDATTDIGSVAVQLAHFYGLHVFASGPKSDLGFVKQLGADTALDQNSNALVKCILEESNNYGVDFVLECGDAALAEEHSQVLRQGGSICLVSGLLKPSCDLCVRNQYSIHYVSVHSMLHTALAKAQLRPLLDLLVQLHMEGAFRFPNLVQVPLARANNALNFLANHHVRGKLVLTDFHEGQSSSTP